MAGNLLFTDNPGNHAPEMISLFNERHIGLVKNSLVLAVGTTCLSLAIGIPLAFLFQKTDLWLRNLFATVYIIPVLIPPYIQAIVWTHLDSVTTKWLNLNIYSPGGAIFVLTLTYFPFVTLPVTSGLRSIDRPQEEAGLLFRCPCQTLSRITLPLVLPYAYAGAVFVFIFSVTDFGVPDILRVHVYPVEIFIQFSAFYNEKAATMLSLPLMGIAVILLLIQRWSMKERVYVQLSGDKAESVQYHLGNFKPLAFGFCIILMLLSVGVPVWVLLKTAGSLALCLRVLSTSINQIAYSLVLAFCGAGLTVVLGFFLAYQLERNKASLNKLLSVAVFIPLAVPSVTLGIGLIQIWNRVFVDYIYSSSLIIIFGYVGRFIPFAVIMLISGLKHLSPRLEEAALLFTPRWSEVVGKITVPLLKYTFITSFFIIFILSFGELGTTLMVIPPGKETVPVKIYNLMHYGSEPMVAALCIVILVIIMTFSGLFLILKKISLRT
jgi:iron(III) transport system permease protein